MPRTTGQTVSELHLLSLLLGAFAVGTIIASLFTDCWQINSKGSVMLSRRCKGLWRECVWDSFVKIWTCDHFNSYLNPHPATIVITRSLMVTAAILSVCAFLSLILGFKHFMYFDDVAIKRRFLRLAASLYFIVGLCSAVGTLWYCAYVYKMHQFEVALKIPGFPSFEFGYSLWLAIGGALSAICNTVISAYWACCQSTVKTTREETRTRSVQPISTGHSTYI